MAFKYNEIYQRDAREISSIIPEGVVDVTITSPPYFDMKDYGYKEQIGFGQTYKEYLDDLFLVFEGVYKCTKSSGSLWVIIDTLRHNGEMMLIPFDFANRIASIGWKLKEVIIWKKDKTVPWTHSGQMRNAFEYILLFSKSDDFCFNIDRVKETGELKQWWVKYPERYHPKGRTPEDVWEYPIPVQGSWGKNYIRHFCPLPEGLIERILRITTNENDVVLDPFAGSGAVLSKADFMRRRFIGTELNPQYIEMFKQFDLEHRTSARAKYDRSAQIKETVTTFENNICSLRILKYARVLYRRINSEHLRFIAAFPIDQETEKEEKIQARFVLVCSKEGLDIIHEQVNKMISCPPLSKYGIIPMLEIVDKVSLADYQLYTYTKTNSYHFQRKINKGSILSLQKAEVVVSPIYVDFNEQDYE